MKYLASLFAVLCVAAPATGFSKDHHHSNNRCDWHGRSCPPSVRFYGGGFPVFASPWPYYGYYSSPSVGVSFSTGTSYATYRGTRVDDRADDLSVDVQRALRHEGYYRGEVDGDIGAGTRAAIRQYQYDHHLEVTGRIDRALLRALDLD